MIPPGSMAPGFDPLDIIISIMLIILVWYLVGVSVDAWRQLSR